MTYYFYYFLIYAIIFIIGISIGSFLNVIIYRVPAGISFAKGRSMCTNCQTTIKPYDLVPVLSYFILKGKCRACGSKISIRYPMVELFTGLMFISVFLYFGLNWYGATAVAFGSILIAITMIDFDTMTIPNGLVISLIPIALLFFIGQDLNLQIFETTINLTPIGILPRIIGVFAISLPMYLLTLLIPDAFGGGDIKLIAVCGFILGWKLVLVAMFIAVILGAIVAIVVIAKGKKGTHIPFGPYLAVGCFLSLLFGNQIINWYINLLF